MTDDAQSADDNSYKPPTKVLGREPRVVRKRFYKVVTVAPHVGGYTVHLDGRGVRTPAKAPLVVPVAVLAKALADEWRAQASEIVPSTMPLTTLACTAIDAVTTRMPEVAAEIGRYASSDHLCYRADAPAALVALQAAGWDPVLDWASLELGVAFKRTTGLMPVAQSPGVADAMVAALLPLAPLQLAAMHVLTSLMGSAVLALAVLRGRLSLDAAWQLAHIDEQWQIARWGTDAEAEARSAQRYRTASAAGRVLDGFRAAE